MQDINHECDPVYAKVDQLLDVLTKSKALHILLELHLSNRSMSFTELKKHVDSSSTTVSRRLDELETFGLINRFERDTGGSSVSYGLTSKAKTLSPCIQSLYDWCAVNK